MSTSHEPESFISLALPDPRPSHHCHAVLAGPLVFVSGAIAQPTGDGLHVGVTRNAEGDFVHDIDVQFRSAMQGVLEVLAGVGCTLRSIAEVCVYLLDVRRDFTVFNLAYGEMFSDWLPARTTVEVSGLPSHVGIEIKVTAVRP